MRLLTRYLLRQNIFLMFTVLIVGMGIYLLTDLFDRLDDFLEAGVSTSVVLLYFFAKLPLIISQILPAVFLLATILQLCIMARSRELVALQAGGISFLRIARVIILYGLVWAVAQLAFSQFLGVKGENIASRIWSEQVRKRAQQKQIISNVWFTEGLYVVHMQSVQPAQRRGNGITIYELSPDEVGVRRVMRANSADARKGEWTLHAVSVLDPEAMTSFSERERVVPLAQDVGAFSVIDPKADLQHLPLWQLWSAMRQLRESGSNVEALATAFQMKLAYAGSVVVMGLLSLMLITWKDSLAACLTLGLMLTFFYYALFTVGGSLGERGLLPPVLAAWGTDIIFGGIALARILWVTRQRGGSQAMQTA